MPHPFQRRRPAVWRLALIGLTTVLVGRTALAELPTHPGVEGRNITGVELADRHGVFQAAAWDDLGRVARLPGTYAVRMQVAGLSVVELPVCAGRGRITADGAPVAAPPGPLIVHLGPQAARVTMEVVVSGYEKRIACGGPPRGGVAKPEREGLGLLTFASPQARAGGGRAAIFVPPGHDTAKPGALLVGAHPWGGGIWTYAAYGELLREAASRDVVLLMPSGLGNSLYTAEAEAEVMRAIDALSAQVAVDPRRVSLWGASMGGAGATTIGFHHPDRFATVTSFFGDSRYDLSTYVRGILPDEAAAHAVNGLDVVDNARHIPVWLIHGEDDRVSPITQSTMLARALNERHFAVRFDRVPQAGHEGGLVAKFAAELVKRASEARAIDHPARVTFKSVRPGDIEAYGVRILRRGSGDAEVDVERRADGVHVLRASGVRAITLARGALGAPLEAPIVVEPAASPATAQWEAR